MANETLEQQMQQVIKRQAQMRRGAKQSDTRVSELETAFVGIFNMVAETAQAQKALTADVNRLAGHVDQLIELESALAIGQIETNKRIDKLVESSESSKIETDERFRKMAETHAETDERLNIFINVLERYISEGRNGRPKK